MSALEAEVDRSAREGVERELLAWMSEAKPSADAERFERLALALFRFQFTACAPYARLCASLDRTPDRVEQVSDIPAVPTGAFKEFDLRCFPEDQTTQVFRTSGTSVDRRGALHLDSVVLYEASLLANLRHSFLPGLVGTRPEMRFLSPGPAEAPDSSLTHMFEALRLAEGHPSSDYDLREGRLDLHAFEAAVERARRADRPLIVAGTSFAFVHFLDDPQAAGETRWHLPAGSRVMETGGFKGRSRTVPREVLRSEIAARLKSPATRNELKIYPSIITALARGDWSRIVLCDSKAHPEFSRQSIAHIAQALNVEPFDAIYDLLLDEIDDLHGLMIIAHSYREQDLRRAFEHPACMIGSDATALAPDGPLAASTFHGAYTWAAWFFRHFVRDTQTLSAEEAVRRLTSLPAGRLNLKDRGLIQPNAWADLAIFDPLTFGERGTTFEPNQTAGGMVHVLVNGVVTVENGELTGKHGGRVLRR